MQDNELMHTLIDMMWPCDGSKGTSRMRAQLHVAADDSAHEAWVSHIITAQVDQMARQLTATQRAVKTLQDTCDRLRQTRLF